MSNNSHIGRLVGICALTGGWWTLVVGPSVTDLIAPGVSANDLNQPQRWWQEEVIASSEIILLVAAICAVLWYFYGLTRHIERWSGVNHRWEWHVGLVVTVCIVVYMGLSVTRVGQGRELVYAVYAFHGCGFYYLATVLCSPARWKYTPPLAAYFRKL